MTVGRLQTPDIRAHITEVGQQLLPEGLDLFFNLLFVETVHM